MMLIMAAGTRLARNLGGLAVFAVTGSILTAPALAQVKTGPPAFKSSWKLELPADVVRAAVADLSGDGKLRLLTLDADGTMTLNRITEGKLERGASIQLGKGASKFVTGRFAKGKPAVIVTPAATAYLEQDKLVLKPVTANEGAMGSVRMKDGSELFFVLGQGSGPTTFTVDLAATPVYKQGPELPQPMAEGGSIRELVVEFTKDFFEMAPFPDAVKRGGIARLIDPRASGRIYGLFSWEEADGSYAAVLDGADIFPEPKPDAKPIWRTPKLAGKVLDIALGSDLKGAKSPGFYVLYQTGADLKGRTLEYFELD